MGLLGGNGKIPTPRSASDIATELIREAIFDGRLAPGQRLKEEKLAQELGISRTPVREALLILQTEGLVSAELNRGAMVKTYTERDLIDIYDLRALLESFAARQAALRLTEEAVETLTESCDRFRELRLAGDMLGLIRENLTFHQTIVNTAGTAKLADLVRSAVELPLVYRSFFWFSEKEMKVSEQAHRRLLATLRTGDADRAELLMKEHIYEGRDFLIARFRTPATATQRSGETARGVASPSGSDAPGARGAPMQRPAGSRRNAVANASRP